MTDTAYDGRRSAGRERRAPPPRGGSPSKASRSAHGDATVATPGASPPRPASGSSRSIHLSPLLSDHGAVLEDARAVAPDAQLGEDGQILA